MGPSFVRWSYDRFEGERAYRQLGEVYQALRLYVNGFQPSMKLQAKHYDGRKVRRVYDAAKTPLQRLLLSQMLPASKTHELQRVAQVLDPLRLFYHLQALQQALLRFKASASPDAEEAASVTFLSFCVEQCLARSGSVAPEHGERALQEQVTRAPVPAPVSSYQPEQDANRRTLSPRRETCPSLVVPSQQPGEERVSPSQPITEEKETICSSTTTNSGVAQDRSMLSDGPLQMPHASASPQPPHRTSSKSTLDHAIQDYLEDQKRHHRRPKTLQWHEQALGLFQSYLLIEHQCILLDQITEAQVGGWLAALPLMPTAIGTHRSPGTVASYARSARAFCQWLVRHRYLPATPFAHRPLPPVETCSPHPIEPEEWDQLLLACHPPKETGALADRATARNRALLWVLFDTGMRVSEVCRLRLGDVDPERGILLVRGKGATARRLTLGQEGLCHLRAYLDDYCLGGAGEDHLFLSETGRPFTKSGMALMFGRLKKQAGITRKGVNASLLRESFATRYLLAGGEPGMLWELLGQREGRALEHGLQTPGVGMTNQRAQER